EAAARPAAGNVPEVAARLPEGSEKNPGIVGIHRQIDRAGIGAAIEDLLPAPAAVARTEDAALLVGAENVAQRRHIDEVGVRRMDADAADMLGRAQPDIRPGAAGIARLVEAVAIGDVEPDLGLAGARVDDIAIGARDGDGADGRAAEKA